MSIALEECLQKGSELWIKTLVNLDNGKDLGKAIRMTPGIESDIHWLSPLKDDNYKMYTLDNDEILGKLEEHGIHLIKGNLDFWPNSGVRWDAIGISDDILVLVEARSNVKETYTSIPSSISEDDKKLIEESMTEAFHSMNRGCGDFDAWTERYYQLGKRFTYIHFLKKMGIKAKLIILNIVNDPTYIKTTDVDWCDHYFGDKGTRGVFEAMTGAKPRNVALVNYNVEMLHTK